MPKNSNDEVNDIQDFLEKKYFLQAACGGKDQDLEMIKNYIKNHSNVLDIEDEKHNNVLDIAAMSGNDQIVQLLINELDIPRSKFCAAIEKTANPSKIVCILKKGYFLQTVKHKIDLPFIENYIKVNFYALKTKDKENNNALDIAAMRGHFQVVKMIIDGMHVSADDLRIAITKANTVKNNGKIVDFLETKLQKVVTNSYVNYKPKSHFVSEGYLLEKESWATFSHTTSKVKKAIPRALKSVPISELPQKYKHRWYLKEVKDATRANREVVAQELFRLLSPGHPKTRVVIDKNSKHFVVSKEITGGKDLPHSKNYTPEIRTLWNSAFKDGTITGLGEVATIARLMHETDLRNGNLKIDSQNRLIKFDGDWCFSSLRDPSYLSALITTDTIKWLPLSEDGTPNHWLGCVVNGHLLDERFLDDDLSIHPRVRAEINYALLKIILLPDGFIKNFIGDYVNNSREAKAIYDDFMSRKNQMHTAAMQDSDFINYLKTDLAEIQFVQYISYLKTFKTTGKAFVFEMMHEPEKLLLARFDAIKKDSFLSETQKRHSLS